MEEKIEGLEPQNTQEKRYSPEELKSLEEKASLSSQNFERLKKVQEQNKILSDELENYKKPKENSGSDYIGKLDEIDQKVELRLRGYSQDEISEIHAYATAKKINLLEAVEAPFVKGAIKSIREEQKSRDNTPEPSSRSHIVYQGKTFREVLIDPKATESDKQAAFDAMRARRVRNNE